MTKSNGGSAVDPKSVNALVIGNRGTFLAEGGVYSLPADVRDLLDPLRNERTRKLTLHIHGGLTPLSWGLETARRMLEVYKGVSRPLTLVWGSGASETIEHNVEAISSTEMFEALLHLAIKTVLERFVGGAGARGDVGDEDVRAILADEHGLDHYDAPVRNAASRLDPADADELEQSLAAELNPQIEIDGRLANARAGIGLPRGVESEVGQRGEAITLWLAYKLGRAVVRLGLRYANGRDHGLRETVFEELIQAVYLADLGSWVWQRMKDRTAEMWLPDAGTVLDLERHVGTALLEGLNALGAEVPDLTLDVVGHSAGAIALCHLLAEVSQRTRIKVRNVVFLAPACTVDQFYDEVVSQPARFDRFMMFALRDAAECRDAILPGLYGKSLLYLVSGALERQADEAILGLERHTTGKPPYETPKAKAVHEFLSVPGRTVWAEDPAASGLSTRATSHGGFNTDPCTLESLRAIVSG